MAKKKAPKRDSGGRFVSSTPARGRRTSSSSKRTSTTSERRGSAPARPGNVAEFSRALRAHQVAHDQASVQVIGRGAAGTVTEFDFASYGVRTRDFEVVWLNPRMYAPGGWRVLRHGQRHDGRTLQAALRSAGVKTSSRRAKR